MPATIRCAIIVAAALAGAAQLPVPLGAPAPDWQALAPSGQSDSLSGHIRQHKRETVILACRERLRAQPRFGLDEGWCKIKSHSPALHDLFSRMAATLDQCDGLAAATPGSGIAHSQEKAAGWPPGASQGAVFKPEPGNLPPAGELTRLEILAPRWRSGPPSFCLAAAARGRLERDATARLAAP